MNLTEETVEHIARFLQGEEDVPTRVSNAMLLVAIRALSQEVAEIRLGVYGPPGDAPGGLVGRVARLERAARLALWALSPVALAFLGAVGGWLFEALTGK